MNIIHIGYPKTATTSLQKHLFPKLEKNGLVNFYFGVSYSSDWSFLYRLNALLRPSLFDFQADSLQSADIPTPFLISNEQLLLGGNSSELASEIQKSFGSDTAILITFREPWDLFVSAYFQFVKYGWEYSLDEYVKVVSPKTLDVRDTIDAFVKRFDLVVAVNKDSLEIEPWLHNLFPQDLEIIDEIWREPLPRVNESLSAIQLARLEKLNRNLLPILTKLGYEKNLGLIPFSQLSARKKYANFLGRVILSLKKTVAEITDSKSRPTINHQSIAELNPQLWSKFSTLEEVEDFEIWRNGRKDTT